MKKFIPTLLIMMLVSLASSAQKNVPKELKAKASEYYSEAMNRIALGKDEPHLDCSAHLTTHRNVAAIGIQEFKSDFYCYDMTEDDLVTKISTPFFIRQKYNVAAREYTQEFVADEKGNLLFYLMTGPDDNYSTENMEYEDGSRFEVRIYFDGKGAYGYSQFTYPGTGKQAKFVKEYNSASQTVKSVKEEYNSLTKMHKTINFH